MQHLRQQKFLKPVASVVLILLAAVLITLPIFINGIPRGNDSQQHFQFALTFYNSLLSGDLSPSLSATSNHGFGDVGVRFYPPFSYYVLAALRAFTGSWYAASSFAFLLWFFVGALGVYLWSREYFDDTASLIAALVYIVAPYHVNEIYNASFFAEFAGAAVLPFCFLFVSRICTKNDIRNVSGLAISFALLMLTHLPTAIIGSVGLAIFALLSLPRADRSKKILFLSTSVVTGLILSSFYWLRMIIELQFVNHATTEFIASDYDFHSNFIAAYFSVPASVYADRFLWFGDLMALVAAGLFIPSLIFFLAGKRQIENNQVKIKGAVAVFLLAVFFATPLSLVVWEKFTLLQKIQFPFRWMVLINLMGVFFVAAGFRYLMSVFFSKFRPLALIATGLMLIAVVFTATQIIKPAIYLSKDGFGSYIENLSNEVSYKCWWAIWAKEDAFSNKSQVTIDDRSVVISNWTGYEKQFEIGSGAPQSARIATFFYPHWKAAVNSESVLISAAEDGTMLVPIPSDAAKVRVFFQEPSYVRLAGIVSVITWFVVVSVFLIFTIRRKSKKLI